MSFQTVIYIVSRKLTVLAAVTDEDFRHFHATSNLEVNHPSVSPGSSLVNGRRDSKL
jgi:hypothetical protein